MSLRELYVEKFGDEAVKTAAAVEADGEGLTKEAADQALEKALEALSPEEAEKVAQVINVFDEESLEFDHDLYKLAAAAEVVDDYVDYEETEKQAAEEIDAAGRLMAHAISDELAKIASEAGEKAEKKGEEKKEETTLSEKLAAAVSE